MATATPGKSPTLSATGVVPATIDSARSSVYSDGFDDDDFEADEEPELQNSRGRFASTTDAVRGGSASSTPTTPMQSPTASSFGGSPTAHSPPGSPWPPHVPAGSRRRKRSSTASSTSGVTSPARTPVARGPIPRRRSEARKKPSLTLPPPSMHPPHTPEGGPVPSTPAYLKVANLPPPKPPTPKTDLFDIRKAQQLQIKSVLEEHKAEHTLQAQLHRKTMMYQQANRDSSPVLQQLALLDAIQKQEQLRQERAASSPSSRSVNASMDAFPLLPLTDGTDRRKSSLFKDGTASEAAQRYARSTGQLPTINSHAGPETESGSRGNTKRRGNAGQSSKWRGPQLLQAGRSKRGQPRARPHSKPAGSPLSPLSRGRRGSPPRNGAQRDAGSQPPARKPWKAGKLPSMGTSSGSLTSGQQARPSGAASPGAKATTKGKKKKGRRARHAGGGRGDDDYEDDDMWGAKQIQRLRSMNRMVAAYSNGPPLPEPGRRSHAKGGKKARKTKSPGKASSRSPGRSPGRKSGRSPGKKKAAKRRLSPVQHQVGSLNKTEGLIKGSVLARRQRPQLPGLTG